MDLCRGRLCLESKGEGIYLLYFALMTGARAAGLYEGKMVYTVLLVIGMLLLMWKIMLSKFSVIEYAITFLLFFVSVMVYFHTGEKGLVVCFATLLGMKAVSVRKTIEVGAIVAGTIVVLKLLLGIFGFSSEIYYPQERAGVGMMFRHAFGYAHPNTMHMNVLMLSMMFVYLLTIFLREKNKNNTIILVLFSFLIFLFNIYIFQYSGSRTGILVCFMYLVINLWLYIIDKIGLLEKMIAYMAFPMVSFVTIVMPFIVNDKLFDILNSTVFHSRFRLAKYFWSNNTISLWGIRLNNPDPFAERYGIDMAQLYLFLQLGIIAFIVVSILSIWFIYECIKYDRRAELAVMLSMLCLGMWEPLLYNLGFKNFTYVFMGAMLYGIINKDMRCFEDSEGLFGNDAWVNICISNQTILKRIGRAYAVSLLIGVCTSLIYVVMTTEPAALYGDIEQGESGNSFGMEPLYLSEAQIKEYKSAGDIIIGYVDDTVPMYRYDETIAHMEYQKRIISVGVWCAIISAMIQLSRLSYNSRRGLLNKSDSKE